MQTDAHMRGGDYCIRAALTLALPNHTTDQPAVGPHCCSLFHVHG